MLYNDYLLSDLAEQRMRDFTREAETQRLLRQAGIRRRTIPVRLASLALGRLGGLLVNVGERLQGNAAPRETWLSAGEC